MNRMIPVLGGGVLLGILATLAFVRIEQPSNPPADDIVRDIVDVPQMAQAVAEQHRDERYANLVNIEQVLALPTEFARAEALHVLAGRSDSAGVQNLIFEANRIADDVERVALLNILFFRLTEADPQSALALARMDQFKAVKSFEQTVWRAWARKDLDDALFGARTQASAALQSFAAQSLYAAFGYMGNETTDRIEAELEIEPNRSSRARYLYQLADRSPAEAIGYINGLRRGREQQELVSWLAYYLASRDPTAALRYAELFAVASDGDRYSNIINSDVALQDPKATIERLLASGSGLQSSGEYHYAVRELASTDLESAKQFFEQARSDQQRQILGSAIAAELAKNDPIEALAWARANDRGRRQMIEMSVLMQIAQVDPQLALAEALDSPNAEMRPMLVSNIVQQIARSDPANGIPYLDQIEDRRQRMEVSEQLASTWIRTDTDAAVEWIFSQDKDTAGQLMMRAGRSLLSSDVDAVIRLLPRLEGQYQESMRLQVAQQLATGRSPVEAQAFIRQFQGQPGYDQLQASVVAGVAQTDTVMAKQLADQIQDSDARNTAYMNIIGQHARTNPAEALRWLNNVNDDRMRGSASGELAKQWYANDPAAATRWVTNLPRGSTRDDTIMHMSSSWREPTKKQMNLIASIEDRDKRGQAKLRQVYNLMRTNPAKARELLEDEDISSEQRQQVETMINQYGFRF